MGIGDILRMQNAVRGEQPLRWRGAPAPARGSSWKTSEARLRFRRKPKYPEGARRFAYVNASQFAFYEA